MKRLFGAIFLVIVMTGVHTPRVYAQHSVIRGSILDENKLSLPGANIVLVSSLDTDRVIGTTSDINGEFILRPVAIGKQSIRVTYMGFETAIVEVDVKFDEIADVEVILKAGVVSLDEVVVVGERLAGQAKALNLQKTNNNVSNIVSMDQMSKFPDSNIGDALKRIPGVAMQQSRGEASVVILRGLGPEYTNVMINGERVSSTSDVDRSLRVDVLPSDMVQTVELSKSILPDMDSDATAGSVNLVTRSAPYKPTFSLTLNSGQYQIENKPVWNGSLIVGDRIFGDKLGLIGNVSYNNKDYGAHNIESSWSLQGVGDDYFLSQFTVERFLVERTRKSATVSLDYKLNLRSTVKFKGTYNNRVDKENLFQEIYRRIGQANQDTGVAQMLGMRYKTRTGINGEPRRRVTTNVYTAKLEGEHLLWSKVEMDWSGSFGRTDQFYMDRDFDWHIRSSLQVIPDFSDPKRPVITFMDQSALDVSNITSREIEEEINDVYENDYRARLNIKIPITIAKHQGAIKFGGVFKHKKKVVDNFKSLYWPKGAQFLNWSSLENHETMNASVNNFMAGDYRFVAPVIDPTYGASVDLYNEDDFRSSSSLSDFANENYDAVEKEQSGYVMLTQGLSSKFTLITGVRVENRVNEYVGTEFNYSVPTESLLSLRSKSTSLDLMPSATLKYDLSESTVLRFAWSNTLIRPSFRDISPWKFMDVDDQELDEGNPDLKPAKSMNFDIMGEKYFESIGQLTIGVFYKDIRDLILRVEDEYKSPNLLQKHGFEWQRHRYPGNVGAAVLYGFEFAFQRRLDFMPGFLRNLSGYVNLSKAKSEIDGLEILGREEEKVGLENTADLSINASLSYETKKFVLTSSLHYTGENILQYGTFSSAFDTWYDKQTFLDINASYRFSPKLSLFLEANNVTNQPLRHYRGGLRDFISKAEYYGRNVNLGFKFNR